MPELEGVGKHKLEEREVGMTEEGSCVVSIKVVWSLLFSESTREYKSALVTE